jgi:hypothetical protein
MIDRIELDRSRTRSARGVALTMTTYRPKRTTFRFLLTCYPEGSSIGIQARAVSLDDVIHVVDGYEHSSAIQRIEASIIRRDGSTGRVWRAWQRAADGGFECLR